MTWEEFCGKAAPIIKERWHQGEKMPQGNGRDWHVGRDLNICKRLHGQGESYEDILGALKEYDGKPMDLRIMWAQGRRYNYFTLRNKAYKKQSTEVPNIKQILREMAQ